MSANDFCSLFSPKQSKPPPEPPQKAPRAPKKPRKVKPSEPVDALAHGRFVPKQPASPEPAPNDAPENADLDDPMVTDVWDDAFEVYEDGDDDVEVRDDTSDDGDSDTYEVTSLATSDLAASPPDPCASPTDVEFGRRFSAKRTRPRRPPAAGPLLALDDDEDIL